MGEGVSNEIGTVVLIRRKANTAHPYGVMFEKVSNVRHDLFCSKHQVDQNGWPILKSEFYIDGDTWYRLPERKGYYFPANFLTLAELKYDPMQQGDKDDDI